MILVKIVKIEEMGENERKCQKRTFPPQGGNVALAQGFSMVWQVDSAHVGLWHQNG